MYPDDPYRSASPVPMGRMMPEITGLLYVVERFGSIAAAFRNWKKSWRA